MTDDPLKATLQDLQKKYFNAIKAGNNEEADALILRAQGQSISPDEIYISIFQPSAYEMGQLWEENLLGVGQEHVASAIIERHMGELHSFFKPKQSKNKKLVLGCVDREYHRIGLRMVADLFEQDGWNVLYMGATVPAEAFVKTVKEFQPDLIGISVEVDYHLPRLTELQMELKRLDIHTIPIMAGGLPFIRNPHLVEELGLTFTAVNAREAVVKANQLIPAD